MMFALHDSVCDHRGRRRGAGNSLQFLFYGGVIVLPVIAAYTAGVYWVFRGKVRSGYGRTPQDATSPRA